MDPNPQSNYTIILYLIQRISARKYSAVGKNNEFPKPEVCPFCHTLGTCLVGWGYYERNACDGCAWYRIYIKIWKCKRQAHGGYISIHPSFLLPYKQYTFRVIYQILSLCIIKRLSIQASIRRVMKKKQTSYQTVQHWIRTLKEKAGIWIGLLQSELKTSLTRSGDRASKQSAELLHVMLALEKYFATSPSWNEKETRHVVLITRYRGSPFSSRRF